MEVLHESKGDGPFNMMGLGTKHALDRRSPPLVRVKKVCIKTVTILDTGVACNSTAVGKLEVKSERKSVSFNDENLEEIIEFEDDLESKNGRKMYWEFMALDRLRFKDRIGALENILAPVFSPSHRNVAFERQQPVNRPVYHKILSTK